MSIAALNSAADASLVMLNLLGGMVGVWLSGGTVTIAAIIGFITVEFFRNRRDKFL